MGNLSAPDYLAPYYDAACVHHAGFRSLLWASRETQAARFNAICRLANPRGKSLLDVGCGRADLSDYCIAHHIAPADYIGIEAVEPLAKMARAKARGHSRIIVADFLDDPQLMYVGAEILVLSGSLNTFEEAAFFRSIRRAFDAAMQTVVFNFLSAPHLAAESYLRWHDHREVIAFCNTLSPKVSILTDYLPGDTTIAIEKELS